MRIAKFLSLFSQVPRATSVEIFLAGMCLEVLGLAIPLFTQVLFDKVIVHSSYSTLHVVGVGMVIVSVFEATLVYLYSRHVHFLAARIDDALMKPAIDHLAALPLEYFEGRPKGEIATDLRGVGEIRQFLAASSITAVIDIIFMAAILVLMVFYSIPLALITAACIPLLGVLSVILRPSVRRRYRDLSNKQGRFEAVMTEGLNNIQTIKTSGLESNWHKKLALAHENFVDAALLAKQSAAAEETVLRVVQRGIALGVLWVGASLVLKGELSFGQLIASYMFALRVLGPSARLFQVWLGLQQLEQALGNLEGLLARAPEQSKSAPLLPPPSDAAISFSTVSYRYPKASTDVLRDVSILFPSGSFVGILGQSGSGKSTLAKLVQRHLRPACGSVSLGGVDVSMIDVVTVRKEIKLVTQDSALFQDTVFNNLSAGDVTLTLAQVLRACETAQCREFIEAMPEGFESVLDEKAAQLSSGQRQRLALARAILQRPKVLILDEATNALDAATESAVLQNLRDEVPACTLVVITHRANTVRQADRLFLVEGGQVRNQDQPYPAELFVAHKAPQLHVA